MTASKVEAARETSQRGSMLELCLLMAYFRSPVDDVITASTSHPSVRRARIISVRVA